MDPNANLKEQLQLASRFIEAYENDRPISILDTAQLAELVIALDEWMRKEGFAPSAWKRS